MTDSSTHLQAGDTDSAQQPQTDPSLERLRDILFNQYRQKIAELEAELDDLERRITDKDALIDMIAPVLGNAIRCKIRDAREEMIEALYPIIGQTVVRAVSEAIRDLTRTVDAQMRTSFSLQTIWRRLHARVSGVSSAEMTLRESLPFEVAEVFLIHRETGLLLWHVSRDPDVSPDSDLISGMLTAIRDFARDAFGQGKEGQLEEIQYGERRILIESAQHAYLAVVIDGIEPPGFRAEMRERIIKVEHAHEKTLRRYEGDPTLLAPVEEPLRSLITAAEPRELSPIQKRVLAGVCGLMLVCLATVCLGGGWAWQAVRSTPTPLPTAVAPTATFTATPSPTPTATSSPTPTATPSPIPTPFSTFAPVFGAMTGNAWVHEGPSPDSPRTGLILEQGQPVEILAVFDNWCQVRWVPQLQGEGVGWVSARWVGTATTIPAQIITPTPGP